MSSSSSPIELSILSIKLQGSHVHHAASHVYVKTKQKKTKQKKTKQKTKQNITKNKTKQNKTQNKTKQNKNRGTSLSFKL